LQVCHERQLV